MYIFLEANQTNDLHDLSQKLQRYQNDLAKITTKNNQLTKMYYQSVKYLKI